MKRVSTNDLAILSGSLMLFSDFGDNGPMWSGTGTREVRRRIAFDSAFRDPPHVMVGISMWDMDTETNTRMDIATAEVDRDAFTIVFRTWGDSRLARIRADWTAFGAIRDDEMWDVD